MNIDIIGGDNYSILASGSVITFDDQPMKFRLQEPNTSSPLHLIFNFDDDNKDGNSESRIETKHSGDLLELTIVNATNPLGSGTMKAVPIGQLDDGRTFYINFRVAGGDKFLNKIIHYTFYADTDKKDDSNNA